MRFVSAMLFCLLVLGCNRPGDDKPEAKDALVKVHPKQDLPMDDGARTHQEKKGAEAKQEEKGSEKKALAENPDEIRAQKALAALRMEIEEEKKAVEAAGKLQEEERRKKEQEEERIKEGALRKKFTEEEWKAVVFIRENWQVIQGLGLLVGVERPVYPVRGFDKKDGLVFVQIRFQEFIDDRLSLRTDDFIIFEFTFTPAKGVIDLDAYAETRRSLIEGNERHAISMVSQRAGKTIDQRERGKRFLNALLLQIP